MSASYEGSRKEVQANKPSAAQIRRVAWHGERGRGLVLCRRGRSHLVKAAPSEPQVALHVFALEIGTNGCERRCRCRCDATSCYCSPAAATAPATSPSLVYTCLSLATAPVLVNLLRNLILHAASASSAPPKPCYEFSQDMSNGSNSCSCPSGSSSSSSSCGYDCNCSRYICRCICSC